MNDQADREADEILNPPNRWSPSRMELRGIIAAALRKRDEELAVRDNQIAQLLATNDKYVIEIERLKEDAKDWSATQRCLADIAIKLRTQLAEAREVMRIHSTDCSYPPCAVCIWLAANREKK